MPETYFRDGKFLVCAACRAKTERKRALNHEEDCESFGGLNGLTDREREIASLLSLGETVKTIATLLGISVKTVDAHKSNIYHSLGVHSIARMTRIVVQSEQAGNVSHRISTVLDGLK